MEDAVQEIIKIDGKLVAKKNELALLKIIAQQKWIREDELALLSGMSKTMVSRTCARMLGDSVEIQIKEAARSTSIQAKKKNNKPHTNNGLPNLIYREKRLGGFFIRLRQAGANRVGAISGKGVKIPACWRHHCLAIQVLKFLEGNAKKTGTDNTIQTEAQVLQNRKVGSTDKIPDGTVGDTHIEVEWSKKDGQALFAQAEEICRIAKLGTNIVVAYPYRNEVYNEADEQISGCRTDGRNHERRQQWAIRIHWGDKPAPKIKFLRCYFENEVAYDHCRPDPDRFELIDLPGAVSTKIIPIGLISEKAGYQWRDDELYLDDEVVAQVVFRWSQDNEFEVATFDGIDFLDNGSNEENYSFQVFIKNAITISHKEQMTIQDVINRHLKKKYPSMIEGLE